MGLKTIKEFCHKDNLGEGLVFDGSVFKLNIDKELETIATALVDLNENKADKTDIATVYKVKGTTTVNGVNSINAEVGDVYNLSDSGTITNGIGGSVEVEAGDNVVYTENGWDKLSAAVKMALEAGDNITVEGNKISAKGYVYDKENNSFAEGSYAKAEGSSSHAEGRGTTASGQYSHTEGDGTTASKFASHAEGSYTKAYGKCSHSEGQSTEASGDYSHAEGLFATALGECSHAEGSNTIAKNEKEHAEGIFNVSNKNSDTLGDALNTLHSIGIGTRDTDRKNAQEVMQNGDFYVIGVGNYNGANINEAQTVQKVINSKVDKEDNKGLSTEDYTTEEKTKLNSIEEGALVNTVSSVNGLVGEVVLEIPSIKGLATTEELNSAISALNIPEINNLVTQEQLQLALNTKEYYLDFKEDLTTIQEINISNTWKLNQIVGYNISSINLSIEGQETQVLTLTDNNWVADSLTTILIYPTNRIVWEIIKADETLPAVLGISKIKQ